MSKFILGQVGSRNFNAALLLYNANLLDRLLVDTYFSKELLLAKIPIIKEKLDKKLRKYAVGLPLGIVSYDWTGALTMRILQKYTTNINAFNYANKRLGKRLINYAAKKDPGKYYGFDTSSMEFLEWGADRGWMGYLEQCVAPRSSQIVMWKLLSEKYGINCSINIEQALVQQERERREWECSKCIIVPSEYVKSELLKDGNVKAEKINVVNYGYTPIGNREVIKNATANKFSVSNKKINLLFAGNAGYRKGLADIVKLAGDLKDENISFTIAGKLETEAVQLINKHTYGNIHYLGKLSKEELAAQYLAADVFFFPSYLEGSAMVLLEAMSWGLPILTTFQSGSVIKNGVNGLIFNAGDLESMKTGILKLLYDTDLRYNMAINALESSVNYSVKEYGNNLLNILKH